MKPAAYTFCRAGSVAQAVGWLAGDPDALLLAGGQSLGPMLNLRVARPSRLIDIGGIAALRAADPGAQAVRFGALVTHADVEDGRVPDPARGMMRHVAGTIAWRAVRNMGTLCGSLAHADPAADWPAALLALDARIHLQGPDGPRALALDAFLDDAYTTARLPEEMVVAVEVPALSALARWRYVKSCRKLGEFAEALAVGVSDPDAGSARVVLGATGSRPRLLPVATAALQAGRRPDRDTLLDEIATAAPELAPMTQHRQSVLMQRMLESMLDG